MKDLNVIAAELRVDFIRERVEQIDKIAADLQSPLEVAMLWALCGHFPTTEVTESTSWRLPGTVGEPGVVIYLRTVTDPIEIEIWPQLKVTANGSKYRLDFGLCVRRLGGPGPGAHPAFVDLEVDGHDYHERTREQAERDKKRDRDLQSIGWHVARFTGSEVYRDPSGVAGQAIGFASGLAWREEE